MEEVKTIITNPSNTERLLEVEIPRERFKDIFNDKVKKYSKELRLNGYRKGNIPRRVVEERFRDPLTSESMEKLINDVIKEVCQSHNLKPVAPGQVDDIRNDSDSPITLKATIEIDQDVDFQGYQDIKVTPAEVSEVTEKDVDDYLANYQKSFATEEDVKGPALVGHIAHGEYLSIEIDGHVQQVDPKNSKFRITIGADKIEEFNKAFEGVSSGEEKVITIKHGDDSEIKSLAGKTGIYKVKIDAIKKEILPELNDDLAKRAGMENVDTLRTRSREQLLTVRKQQAQKQAHDEAINKIIEVSPFDIPKARIKQYVEYRQNAQNKGPEKQTIRYEDITPEMKKEAIFQLKRMRIVEEISKKEKIKPSQEEVDDRIKQMAEQYGMDFDTLKNMLRRNGQINEIRAELQETKTMDFLIGRK